MNLIELLKLCGFDSTGKNVKIARHQDRRISVHSLFDEGHFDVYQRYQKKSVFDCDYVVSCLGLGEKLAKVIGIYQVMRKTPNVLPSNLPPKLATFMQETHNCYELKKLQGADDQRLVDDIYERVIVHGWERDPINWCRSLTPQFDVVQILPRHYADEFPGYLNLELSYDKLREMIQNGTRYQKWHQMLKSAKGIYAVFDNQDNRFYVGAAYGKGGFLKRWQDYARNGYGDSTQLQQILKSAPSRVHDFMFSILQLLPNTATEAEVITSEIAWIRKLRARDLGYN